MIEKSNTPGKKKILIQNRRHGSLGSWVLTFLMITTIIYGIHYCKIPIERVLTMFPPFAKMFYKLFYPPNVEYITKVSILNAFLETFQIAFLASFIGTIISIPLAWFAAYNMSPSRLLIYPIARFAIALSRSIDTLLWAILFTHLLGFGPLPGVLSLVLLTIGFTGKLFSEEVEGIKIGPVHAMQATGTGRIQVMYYGALPQIIKAWAGIAIYNWDGVFRAATIVGYVGAGGIGRYLRETIGFMEYSRTGAIIMGIIILVVFSELLSAFIRDKIK